MPHVSRKMVPEETKKVLKEALVFVFSNLKPDEVKKAFSSLLTETEQIMLAKRLGISFLLNENIDDVNIADTVKTTRQTVARIRLQLKAGLAEAKDFLLRRLSSWKRIRILKNTAKQIAISAVKRILRASVGRP